MKHFTLLLSAIFCLSLSLFAKPVDPIQAEKAGLNFLKTRTNSVHLSGISDLTLVQTVTSQVSGAANSGSSLNYYYIFNAGPSGFILVAADDRVSPILGYSDESAYNVLNVPPQVVKWLESYKSQIRQAITEDMQATDGIADEWQKLLSGQASGLPSKRGSVSPLVAAKWNQVTYYNAQCPYDNTYSERTVTGCVATAMAQVMKYWNHPAKGVGSHSYNHDVYGTLSANFSATTYNWGSMPNSVTSSNSAVATLMYHCGVSVDMNYNVASKGGSGAFVVSDASPITNCAEYAFENYFDYKTSLDGVLRANYTNSQWLALIKGEMDASRPVIYAGFGNGGGHCFVADGYDNNDYIHFNWGWGGAYDGYFSINALNPGGVGTGGGTGGFNNNHQAIIGIQPNSNSGSNAMDMRLYSTIYVNPSPVDYNTAFDVSVDIANFGTSSAQNFTGDYAAAVFNSSSQFVAFVNTLTGYSLEFNKHYTNPLVFSTSGISAMTPGTYTIGIYYKPTGATQWYPVSDGAYSNFVSVVVNGNNDNTLRLYAPITTTPTILIQNKTFTVTFDIANYGGTTFDGDVSVDLHGSDGKWIRELDVKTGLSLPSMTHFTNGLTYTITGGLPDEPGTYQFFVWDKPNGGSWEFLGSGAYANPITVQLSAPGLDPDAYEVNNVMAQSYNLPMTFQGNTAKRTTTGSNCHNGNDYDYYKITLPAGFKYTINARVHDAYSSGNGNTYTLDALVSYSTDGNVWSDAFDDVITAFDVNGANTVYFLVSPYFTGNTGTYLFDVNVTRSALTSVSSVNMVDQINVYPNPSEGAFTVRLDAVKSSAVSIKVMDVNGRTLIEKPIHGLDEVSLDLSEMSNGIYIIQIVTSKAVLTKEIIIQR